MINLAWLIPVLPAAAFVVIGLFTRRERPLSAALSIGAVALAAILAYGIFFQVLAGGRSNVTLEWIRLGDGPNIPFGWLVDPLTAVMLVVVTTISLLVQVFSWGYMTEPVTDQDGHPLVDRHGHPVMVHDPGLWRYYAYQSLFVAAMLGLVLANNLATLYIFWEGVGLGSFLLIGFWYDRPADPADQRPNVNAVDERPSPASAAIKAFVTTRLGDFGMLIGIVVIWSSAGTLEFAALADKIEHHLIDPGALTLGAILLFCGAVGKSAQFPLHVWLPDAMEGPTPVSALIHAATMVAAGVYLVARTAMIFEASPQAMFVVAAIGGFTAIFAATMGLVADDLKRVMAYSTISQLGYMMLGLGSGALAAGTFHLFTHAFFKALLFLTAGSVIHLAGSQKLSELGGLRRFMPVTFGTMLIAALSLAGIPPLSGFWSKDAILAATAAKATEAGGYWILLVFAVITVFMTAFYMFRALFLTFFGEYRGHHQLHHEPGLSFMTVPLIVLAVPSILVGLWGSPFGGDGFQTFVEGPGFHEEVNAGMAVLGTVLGLGGIALAYLMYYSRAISPVAVTSVFRPLYALFAAKYYLDDFYQALINRILLAFANFIAFVFDTRVVDGAVNGAGRLAVRISAAVRPLQTGQVQNYAMAVFGGLALISLLTIILRPR